MRRIWSVDYLCSGASSAVWSSPVVQGNRLVVCGRNDTADQVFCLDPWSGELLWRSHYPAPAEGTHGSGSRATPFIDGNRVYTFGRSGDLACWDLYDGRKIRQRSVSVEGGEEPRWGHSTSPLVLDSMVIVNGGGSARTIAFRGSDGSVAWRSGSGEAGYSALTTCTINGKPTVLSFHGTGLAALSPHDGTTLWDFAWETANKVNATTPVVAGRQVFITSGYGTGCALLEMSARGCKELWRNKSIASHHSDPHIIDGHIYGYSGLSMQNRGEFVCLDLATGAEKWSTGEIGWGTCIRVNQYLIAQDIEGNLFLVDPDPMSLKKMAAFPSALGHITGAAWTTPIVANGTLYLRHKEKLIAFGLRAL